MARLDFHLVSENGEFKVYQAMDAANTKAMPDGSMPKKYTPTLPKKVSGVDDVLANFEGYDVDAVTCSRSGGITVRVKRAKDDKFVDVEPDVTRLEAKGGSAK